MDGGNFLMCTMCGRSSEYEKDMKGDGIALIRAWRNEDLNAIVTLVGLRPPGETMETLASIGAALVERLASFTGEAPDDIIDAMIAANV